MNKDITITVSEERAKKFIEEVQDLPIAKRGDNIWSLYSEIKSQLPVWDRQGVLEFKYDIPEGDSGFTLRPHFGIERYTRTNSQKYFQLKKEGWIFAPTKDLIEECKAIWEGTWLPKKGDAFIYCNKNEFYIPKNREVDVAYIDFSYDRSIYAPSLPQLTSWIERNKPIEAESEIYLQHPQKGEKYFSVFLGQIVRKEWCNTESDNNIFNCELLFRTREAAEKQLRKEVAYTTLAHECQKAGGRLEWSEEYKCTCTYNSFTGITWSYQKSSSFFFKTKDEALFFGNRPDILPLLKQYYGIVE